MAMERDRERTWARSSKAHTLPSKADVERESERESRGGAALIHRHSLTRSLAAAAAAAAAAGGALPFPHDES